MLYRVVVEQFVVTGAVLTVAVHERVATVVGDGQTGVLVVIGVTRQRAPCHRVMAVRFDNAFLECVKESVVGCGLWHHASSCGG